MDLHIKPMSGRAPASRQTPPQACIFALFLETFSCFDLSLAVLDDLPEGLQSCILRDTSDPFFQYPLCRDPILLLVVAGYIPPLDLSARGEHG